MSSSRVADGDYCSLSRRWTLDPHLADMLVRLDDWARGQFSSEGLRWPGLFVISGYRSQLLQAQINPAAPKSLHTYCPALAADLRVGDIPASLTTTEIWSWLASWWGTMGGRWGGSFTPPDENHFDIPAFAYLN